MTHCCAFSSTPNPESFKRGALWKILCVVSCVTLLLNPVGVCGVRVAGFAAQLPAGIVVHAVFSPLSLSLLGRLRTYN